MAADVAVAIIHGIGSQKPGYSDELVEELQEKLDDRGPGRVAFHEIYWQDVVQQRQSDYLDRAMRAVDLDYVKLRRLVVEAIGDAGAYRKVSGQATSTYTKIHDVVRSAIASLRAAVGDKDKPLIVMAHSLGGHIMSNYIWDAQQPGGDSASNAFENLKTHAGMITFGCNIPLFTFAHGNIQPIGFPGPELSPGHADKAKWLNYFDPDDILGYPLKPLAGYGDMAKLLDHEINVGNIFQSWNPLSHNGYWTDDDFTDPVADYIADFL